MLGSFGAFVYAYYMWKNSQIKPAEGKPEMAHLKAAIATGAFIVLYDLVWENLGLILNWWRSNQALFYIGYCPADVLFDFFFMVSALCLFFPKREDTRWGLLFILAGSIGNEFLEKSLVDIGLMNYMTYYNVVYATALYAIAWILMYGAFYKFYNYFKKSKPM